MLLMQKKMALKKTIQTSLYPNPMKTKVRNV